MVGCHSTWLPSQVSSAAAAAALVVAVAGPVTVAGCVASFPSFSVQFFGDLYSNFVSHTLKAYSY